MDLRVGDFVRFKFGNDPRNGTVEKEEWEGAVVWYQIREQHTSIRRRVQPKDVEAILEKGWKHKT